MRTFKRLGPPKPEVTAARIIEVCIPAKIRDAAIASMLGAMADSPQRVGKPLAGGLAGLWLARRGDYRVVYEIDDDAHTIVVHRVQHRGDVSRRR